MPIRSEDRGRYPADWAALSRRIREERAGWQCETILDGVRCGASQGQPHPVTESPVVLTVGHLDHTPENNAPENLRAMCQRCHLAHDRFDNLLRRRRRRGQPDLLEVLHVR